MSLKLKRIHHTAIICSDYGVSRHFYTEVLNLKVLAENYRAERQSYKLDLAVGDYGQIELFSFPNPPARVTNPEAAGLRHLAFLVDDVEAERAKLLDHGIDVMPVRIDEYTGKKFVFFFDPDGLPLELYEE
ncbi:MAG: VOC family protein [Cyanobacteria bacterium SZAS LIN-3]|nr:VOC family protein [Cyanobacteria bacterium SZAS LIN-3]MBS2009099.1 VOC family protein [Cyanobacteria bacterium SZAS TMP-1]